jgi:hypothetical protein
MRSPRQSWNTSTRPSNLSPNIPVTRNTRSANSTPPNSRRSPHSPSSRRFPPRERLPFQSLLKNERCIELRESLFDKLDFTSVNDEDLKLLIGHLREHTQNCALQEFYAHALQSQQLLDSVRTVLATRISEDRTIPAHTQLEEKWIEIRQQYDEETESKREELREKHEHENRLFERQWTMEMPHQYKKPSQRLLELKQIETKLVFSMQFGRAISVHQQVQAKINAEAEAAQRNLIRDYNLAREKHFEQQRLEMEQFESNCQKRIDLLKTDFKVKEEIQLHHETGVYLEVDVTEC